MRTSDFDYSLPAELIAQTPVELRDQARLMVLNRRDGALQHRKFFQIVDYLKAGDVMVFNNSRVVPSRLMGRKMDSGGRVELLLLRRFTPKVWEALVRPGKRVRIGTKIEITDDDEAGEGQGSKITGQVVDSGVRGTRLIDFSDESLLPVLSKIALPPYIHLPLADTERYQTVYASVDGSIAAPTAGLHFTPELIAQIKEKGVGCLFVTLHVELDTFGPVREGNPREHHIRREYGVVGEEVARALSQAQAEGRRIIAVGTTTVRLLEAAAQASRPSRLESFAGWVNLFILPGYQFRVVDALITNFHLPRSTLLMLVTAFAGRELINQAYQEAIARQYRFYSFGDAMLVL